ncbi:hypothetical protein NA57DRAFT_56891 [Rhizodiscina lignyota]|uniref:Uncharacterized protein n=1 Tax=Rhizodiscina lignyota TaxID=1504668 RepID=A0A9P4IE83_9PEZI|nr:hypothetical protein NA57DRAFT_56891 [Rhizodiscina lignyota]
MDSLSLEPLSTWSGSATVYTLPPTNSTLSKVWSTLAGILAPHIPPSIALTLVTHTHLAAHEHANDYLVYLTDIGEDGEAILGFLTRCERCIDLWNVATSEQCKLIDELLEDAEGAGEVMWIERVRAAGERWEWWYGQAMRVHMNRKTSLLRVRGTAATGEIV